VRRCGVYTVWPLGDVPPSVAVVRLVVDWCLSGERLGVVVGEGRDDAF